MLIEVFFTMCISFVQLVSVRVAILVRSWPLVLITRVWSERESCQFHGNRTSKLKPVTLIGFPDKEICTDLEIKQM